MKSTFFPLTLTLLFNYFALIPFGAFASLWDSETSRLNVIPYQTVMQVLVGNHLKHSQNYHFWRISVYEETWNKNPDSISLYDDIAVSYHLTGQTKEAIRMMILKERRKPNQYTTYANLMSFYVADRELYKARFYAQKLLKRHSPLALRDKYQMYWIDYLIECAARKGATKKLRRKFTLPVQGDFSVNELAESRPMYQIPNFYTYLAKKFHKKKKKSNLSQEEVDEAIFAMIQLLRFSEEENIILLEAIGDLFLGKAATRTDSDTLTQDSLITLSAELGLEKSSKGAAQLAAFAYLRAAQLIADYSPKAEKSYTLLATEALLHHQILDKRESKKYSIEDILVFLTHKIRGKENYLNPIFEQEKEWIKEGLDIHQEFAQNYFHSSEDFSDSIFFIKTDTISSSFIFVLNDNIPDYLVVDSLQKAMYVATFMAEKKALEEDETVIVSRIDTETSIKVGLTALAAFSLALILYLGFRKK